MIVTVALTADLVTPVTETSFTDITAVAVVAGGVQWTDEGAVAVDFAADLTTEQQAAVTARVLSYQVPVDVARVPDRALPGVKMALNTLTSAELASLFVLANTFTTAVAGSRVTYDTDGFRAFRPDGSVFFDVSPAQALVIADGIINAKRLTTTEGASLGGITEIAKGGAVRLTKGTTAPSNPPTVTVDVPSQQFTDDGLWGSRSGWATDGTHWYTVRLGTDGYARVEKWAADGTLVATSTYTASSSMVAGVAVYGGNMFMLNRFGSANWSIKRFAASNLAWLDSGDWNDANGTRLPVLGVDPATGELLIAQSRTTDDKVRIRRYTYNAAGGFGTLTAGTFVDTFDTEGGDLAGVAYGSFDLGTNRYVYAKRNGVGNQTIFVLNTAASAVRQTAQEWKTGAGAGMARGLVWDGAAFRSMDAAGMQRTYTGVQQDSIHLSSTLRSATAANTSGGVGAETSQSPRASILAGVRRTRINYSASPIQGTGNPNDPTAVSIYVGTGATDPGIAGMARQAAPANGVVSGSLTSLVLPPGASNPSPPASSTFEAGVASRFEMWDGQLMIGASGEIPASPFRDSVDARVAAVATPSAPPTWTAYTPTWTAATNPTLGNGSLTGRYQQDGKTVHYRIDLTIGSTTNIGSGVYVFSLPVAPAVADGAPVGSAFLVDASAAANAQRLPRFPYRNAGSTAASLADINGVRMTAVATPVIAVGDIITIAGTYEAA